MNTEDKKTLGVAILLGLVVSFSILAIVWNAFLNKGRIKINAQAPYSVEIFGVDQVQCKNNPCEIGSKAGEKTLILEKAGYKTKVQDVNFPLWRTNEINIEFEIIPYIKEVTLIPKEGKEEIYEITKDESSKFYKLVSSTSPKPLAYFPSKITSPKIFGTKNAVVILDSENSSMYKVDLDINSRVAINVDLPKIASAQLSEDKNNLLITEAETGRYWLLDLENQEIFELEFLENDTNFAWMGDQIIFATKLGVQTDELGNSTIVSEVSELGVNVVQYDTKTKNIKFLTRIQEAKTTPIKIIPTTNQQVIYFTLDEKNLALFIK